MTQAQGTKRKADALEENPLTPCNTNGFYIKHAPEKDMTGVDPSMTRLCASVAGQIYSSNQDSDFKLSIGDIKADVVHFEDHGNPYGGVTPDMVVVVSGTTMIIGWQGTSDLNDWITDFHMVPITSARWSNISKEIKVHAGFASIIENDLECLDSLIVKKMEENNITELIVTGHSLGGALAQVAHLCIQAALHDESSIWSQYKKKEATFSVRTVAFSAPMSISTIASPLSAEMKTFFNEIAVRSCNIVYHLDFFPRLLSGLDFVNEVAENIIEGVNDIVNLPSIISRFVNLSDIAAEKFKDLKKNENIKPIIAVLKTFNHYGNIIYYQNDAAKPVVYRDYNHDEASCDKKFSDLEWEHQDIEKDIINNLAHDHTHTVRGPGLAYNIPDYKLAGKCYMMDEFEIMKNNHDVGEVQFTNFNDCVKKAKEAMHNASYAAVAVWDKGDQGKAKFERPGTLYIKNCVPAQSTNANVQGVNWFNQGVKNKATFWRSNGLNDWVKEKSPAADIHDGIVELK